MKKPTPSIIIFGGVEGRGGLPGSFSNFKLQNVIFSLVYRYILKGFTFQMTHVITVVEVNICM